MSASKVSEHKLPDIGGGEATVAEIYVKEGDKISKNDALFMLETDKATMDVPAEQDGIVDKILIKTGDKVSEGQVIIHLKSIDNNATKSEASQDQDQDQDQDNDTKLTKLTTDETNNQANLAKDDIKDNASGGESSTTNEAAKSGVSSQKSFTKGEVEVNISDNKSSDTSKEGNNNQKNEAAAKNDVDDSQNQLNNSTEQDLDEDFSKAFASPSVRKLARELGANLNKIKGTGEKGRITDADLRVYVKQVMTTGAISSSSTVAGLDLLPWPQVDFAKFGEIEIKALSRIKKISGANLARNWVRIPHVTQFDEADITSLEEFRKALNNEYKDKGVKITPLIFIIKACTYALQKFPEFNASIDNDNLIYKKYINIGFAADTPQGLVVPVIKNADKKGVLQLAAESANLAKLAREGQLKPTDMQGGTFTISSLGGIGGTAFTPIINAPEVAILGVSKASMKPIWDGAVFAPKLMLPLSLSYDHRIIDGALAARFSSYLSLLLSDIRRLSL